MTATVTPGQDLEKREDLITLTIDDVEVSVPKGTLVIRAAEQVGQLFPRLVERPLGGSSDLEGWAAGARAADRADLFSPGRTLGGAATG